MGCCDHFTASWILFIWRCARSVIWVMINGCSILRTQTALALVRWCELWLKDVLFWGHKLLWRWSDDVSYDWRMFYSENTNYQMRHRCVENMGLVEFTTVLTQSNLQCWRNILSTSYIKAAQSVSSYHPRLKTIIWKITEGKSGNGLWTGVFSQT
jgi:hypothetical protein